MPYRKISVFCFWTFWTLLALSILAWLAQLDRPVGQFLTIASLSFFVAGMVTWVEKPSPETRLAYPADWDDWTAENQAWYLTQLRLAGWEPDE